MNLYRANGELWDPHYADAQELDWMLRRIVDAIRYRRRSLRVDDPYARAVARLTEAALEYTATRRSDPAAVGAAPRLPPWVN